MNIFVGNLHPDTVANSLRVLFSEFGEVVSFKVIMDNATGISRGFGFVEMADKFQAQNAIDNLDMTYFEGNIISVKEAKQNTTSSSPRGGSGGGFGANRPFRPRAPRPGGFNNGGGFNNDRSRNDSGNSGNSY